jgi:hypothetical protein
MQVKCAPIAATQKEQSDALLLGIVPQATRGPVQPFNTQSVAIMQP